MFISMPTIGDLAGQQVHTHDLIGRLASGWRRLSYSHAGVCVIAMASGGAVRLAEFMV